MSDYLIAWHEAFARRGIVPTTFEWDPRLDVPAYAAWPRFTISLTGFMMSEQLLIVFENGSAVTTRAWRFTDKVGTYQPATPEDVLKLMDGLLAAEARGARIKRRRAGR